MVIVTRLGGLMIIGSVEGAITGQNGFLIMGAPRIFQPAENGGLNLTPILGHPEKIRANIDEMTFMYEPKDQDLLNTYIESVSGIVVAKNMPREGIQLVKP